MASLAAATSFTHDDGAVGVGSIRNSANVDNCSVEGEEEGEEEGLIDVDGCQDGSGEVAKKVTNLYKP